VPITPRLSRKLHQTLGDEAGDDLVTWMQQLDLQRAELRELNELNFSRLEVRFGAIDARFGAIDARFGAIEERLTGMATRVDLAELREEMKVGFATLETKLERRISDLIKWSFVFWVGAVGAVAVLAGVLR
jgi:hypothetical protein